MAYRRTSRVEEQLADRRQRILEAARRLIAEGGFQQAPVAAVAALAGVATGTVYRYFPSKSELLAEVVSQTSQHELEIVTAVAEAEGTAPQRLAAALRAFAGRALRGRRLAYALVAEPLDPAIDAIRLDYRRALARVFEAIIEQGQRAGDFPKQRAAVTAACLVGAAIEGLIGPLSPEAVTTGREQRRLVEGIVAFCLSAVSGKPSSETRPC